MNPYNKSSAISILTSALLFASHANAVPNSALVGQWTIYSFEEPTLTSKGGGWGICFLSGGSYYITQGYPGQGRWFLKGDRLRWTGLYEAADYGFVTETYNGQFSSVNRMSGEYVLRLLGGLGDLPANYKMGNYAMTKTKTKCDPATFVHPLPASEGFSR